MIQVYLKEQEKELELPSGSTGFDLAQKMHLTAPHQALAVKINGKLCDLSVPLNEKDEISFLSFDDEQGKELFWHTSAHVLAQAILRLWPEAKPTIGPPIEQGFYYDFANLHVTEEDLSRIEKEMEKIISENHKISKDVLDKEKACSAFKNNKYKIALIEGFEGEITAYRQGEFYDLCRGPHLPHLGKIKAVKVLKTSGAYWKGDSNNEMLTRIYGITFPDKKMLKEYLHKLEEAKKRDHKILGPKLDLFSLKEEAAGMPFIHPAGMVVWNALLQFWRTCHEKEGYIEIKTPVMMARGLWERSGHWENYRHNMYVTEIENHDYAIKPMNCPGCMLYYKSHAHSYREFPLRIAEIGHVHRYEASGALSGLMRVRCFHQDDAHIFLEMEQVEEEIAQLIRLMEKIYRIFNLDFTMELSTRPKEGTIGSDEAWESTTSALKNALDKMGVVYTIKEGEGAFYGPKIDVHIQDALGRRWQCSTIQLDMSLPERFDLLYVAKDGSRKRPVMIHRAIFGSIERFFGVLIEHFAGKFPLWLSPRQVRLIPVADRHVEYAKQIAMKLKQCGFHVDVDDSSESVGKKIREAQILQYNYMLTVGDKEVEHQTLSLRTRDNVVYGEISFETFKEMIEKEKNTYSLQTPFKEET